MHANRQNYYDCDQFWISDKHYSNLLCSRVYEQQSYCGLVTSIEPAWIHLHHSFLYPVNCFDHHGLAAHKKASLIRPQLAARLKWWHWRF